MVKFLINLGADPHLKASLSQHWVTDTGTKFPRLTPIEFASDRGCLDKLNEVLGTQYKDTRKMKLQESGKRSLLTRFKGLYKAWGMATDSI